MPIVGLTDRTPSFKEIGRLRLGISKADMDRIGKGPSELPYFRADFRPDEGEASRLFDEAYGAKPVSIRIRLPFSEVARCWDAYYEVYNTAGMLGQADGVRWLYLRDNRTGALLVKDGVPQTITPDCKVDGDGQHYKPFDKSVPVYSYRSEKKKVDVAVFAKPKGKLQVIVPELKRAAYVTMVTNSIYNVMNLSAELAGIEQTARNAGLSLPYVPMLLTRRKDTISVSIDGRKSMQEKYLCHIEIDPDWMTSQVAYLDGIRPGMALPEPKPAPVFELPAGEIETGEVVDYHEDDYGDYGDGLELAPELPEPEPTPAKSLPDTDAPCTPVNLVRFGLDKIDNTHHAGKIIELLKLGGVAMGPAVARIELYRKWKDLTDDTKVSAENAIAGAVPPEM